MLPLAVLLGPLTGCVTSASVEDADLFSAGNLKRYKQEQADRERRQAELEADTRQTKSRLEARGATQRTLAAEEAQLRSQLAAQDARLSTLQRDINAARGRKLLTQEQHSALLRSIQQMRATARQISETDHPTGEEISQGRTKLQQSEPIIRNLENLSRQQFRDVSKFINNLS